MFIRWWGDPAVDAPRGAGGRFFFDMWQICQYDTSATT